MNFPSSLRKVGSSSSFGLAGETCASCRPWEGLLTQYLPFTSASMCQPLLLVQALEPMDTKPGHGVSAGGSFLKVLWEPTRVNLARAGPLPPPREPRRPQPVRCQHVTFPPLNYSHGQDAEAASSSFARHLKPPVNIRAFSVGFMALTGSQDPLHSPHMLPFPRELYLQVS